MSDIDFIICSRQIRTKTAIDIDTIKRDDVTHFRLTETIHCIFFFFKSINIV